MIKESEYQKVLSAAMSTVEVCHEVYVKYKSHGWDDKDATDMAKTIQIIVFPTLANSGE